MSARKQLATALVVHLAPSVYRVIDHQDSVDQIAPTERVVIVYQARVAPTGGIGVREVSLEVWVLVPAADPALADDQLEASLEDILAALDTVTWAHWTDAERGVYADAFHGYRITVTARTTP